ncbi:MAG: hypothetical protein KJ955_08780 [Nanoarchaeota archaeon]|nr:hypothetical protein [Nanoarchaeota archaeon]
MIKLQEIVAVAAAVGMYSSDAIAQERHESESRIEHRLENPLPENTELTFVSLTPQAAIYLGVENVELNHALFGYAAGEKLNAHIGLGSLLLDEDDENSTELSLGLGLSTSFAAIVTGGVYDGFVAQQNLGFSAMFLGNDSVSGGFYAGTGVTFVSTLDPWKNQSMGVYGNLNAGARLIFCGYGALELETGGLFSAEDNGWYLGLGIGVALPEVRLDSPE